MNISVVSERERGPAAVALPAPPPAVTGPSLSTALGATLLRGIRLRRNWLQLGKFCTVGASGYVVNLAVYSTLLGRHVDFRLAAAASFVVAVTSNYMLNRAWTFRAERGHVGLQGARFLAVSLSVLAANLVVLTVLAAMGLHRLPAQAVAIVLATPINFLGNKLWSFRR